MKIKYLSSLVALALVAPAFAGPIGPGQTLQSLIGTAENPDPGIVVGDKLFHEFSYSFTGDMPIAGQVNVIPFQDAFGNWGIEFQAGFQDTPGNGPSDALIHYTVEVIGSEFAISDAHIAGGPTVVGTGQIAITETFVPEGGSAMIRIFAASPGQTQLMDSVDFLPDTFVRLHVQKDILADAGPAFIDDQPNLSIALVTFVDQTFSQVPTGGGGETPEPASLGVLALGAVSLLLRRRTRKA